MGKRKLFTKANLSLPVAGFPQDSDDSIHMPSAITPPMVTVVRICEIQGNNRSFDFGVFYGAGIDLIALACQRQIERFVAGEDKVLSPATILSLCTIGLKRFLHYLIGLSHLEQKNFGLVDIDRKLIDGYLLWLRDTVENRVMQRDAYTTTKAVLVSLSRRGLMPLVEHGDNQTFPKNPFPRISGKSKSNKPLTKSARQAVSKALREAVAPLFHPDTKIDGYLLTAVILLIALHTGRNTTPLLELSIDCLWPHPKTGHYFLMLFKRRGYCSHKVILRESVENEGAEYFESSIAIRTSIVSLIRRVMDLTEPLRGLAPDHLKDRLWLYQAARSSRGTVKGDIIALSDIQFTFWKNEIISRHSLVDSDGKPLQLNVSRLRKTFINRIFEILDGDIVSTAFAAGHQNISTTDSSYLRPGENAAKNWKFMGQILTRDLLSDNHLEQTPVAGCNDPNNGEYAPKQGSKLCMGFLNCLRCRNMVVTGDDLYKLFSFYFRILRERNHMDGRKWKKLYSHIPRLIEREIIEPGIAQKKFKADAVENARVKARSEPHPFWRIDGLIGELEAMT